MDIEIMEVGPREGFQFERTTLPTEAKASLISALAQTGVPEIQAVSFVSRKTMAHVADAEQVMEHVVPRDGVRFSGLWFTPNGFSRAEATAHLTLQGLVTISASQAFAERNWGTDQAGMRALNAKLYPLYVERELPVRISIAAAFGCNFSGRVDPGSVIRTMLDTMREVRDQGLAVAEVALADTMAWANPNSIKSLCHDAMAELGDTPLRLHLHDTRGLGLANALAGMEVGVRRFDTAIAGLGGCPFAGHEGAAGNIATEDFYYMCESLGVRTGLNQDKLVAAGQLAEKIVGHASSSRTLRGGFAPLAF
jgi:hydroxymethylglutaryl-CoA lyase